MNKMEKKNLHFPLPPIKFMLCGGQKERCLEQTLFPLLPLSASVNIIGT